MLNREQNKMANNVVGTGTVDPSAVASVVSGVLNAMGFQQNGGAGDTPSGSGSCSTSVKVSHNKS